MRPPFLRGVCLPLLVACSLEAVDQRFVAERQRLREARTELRERADEDRARRADEAGEAIEALIAHADEHRVAGQTEDLLQLCEGLRRLDRERAADLAERVAGLGDAPEVADRRLRSSWEQELLRRKKLFMRRTGELLNRAIELKATDLAHEFLHEILAFDPDRAPLRRGLGQKKYRDRWLTPYPYKMARAGMVWDRELGWVHEGEEERYAAGEHYDLQTRRWTTLEEANAAHAELGNPWRFRTEHLGITGTAPLAKLVDAANRLEDFYAQIFARYANFFTIDRNDYKLILGMAEHPPLEVVIYRDKPQYLEALPQAPEWSAGLFTSRDDTSYFYGGVSTTMYHEFTHQILHVFTGGNRAPVWLTEGIASYTEAPRYDEYGDLVLGLLKANRKVRSHLAGHRRGSAVNLDGLLSLDRRSWRAAADPGANYAAAAALTWFCMEAEERRYRLDYVDFLRDSYQGGARHDLWDYLGMSEADFRAAYAAWLEDPG